MADKEVLPGRPDGTLTEPSGTLSSKWHEACEVARRELSCSNPSAAGMDSTRASLPTNKAAAALS